MGGTSPEGQPLLSADCHAGLPRQQSVVIADRSKGKAGEGNGRN